MASNLTAPEERAWRHDILRPSLPEVHSTMPVPQSATWLRKLLAFAGPGFLVAVGYMDPGNWATDLAGGSKYNYTLLSVILLSNLMAVLLQSLCVKLGVVTGRDLALGGVDELREAFELGVKTPLARPVLQEKAYAFLEIEHLHRAVQKSAQA